jgi:ubiquinone/menaquinone biosynthesis C-methylase UbiE
MTDQQLQFEEKNKDYYRQIEDYDWVVVTDTIVGLESFFHRLRQKNFLSKLRPYIQKNSPYKILDAGCGTGLFSRHLPAGSTAVDINPRHIAKAKKHAPHINCLTADLEHLPFGDETFSLIVCTEVIEHFPTPAKPLRELSRVLKKNGLLIGTVPNQSLIWRLRFLSSTRPHEPYHHNYTKKELQTIFRPSWAIQEIRRLALGMNWFFIVQKF